MTKPPAERHSLQQIGAAALADDIGRYNGSYVLAFAGYNAGRSRVKEWIERDGDPRDPKVDPIDWDAARNLQRPEPEARTAKQVASNASSSATKPAEGDQK